MALTSIDGDKVTFKDMRDKVVILHFWSDRCPAERHANPIFMEMEAKYADAKDVVIIGVASNQKELGEKPGKKDDFKKFYTGLKKKRDKVGYSHSDLRRSRQHGQRPVPGALDPALLRDRQEGRHPVRRRARQRSARQEGQGRHQLLQRCHHGDPCRQEARRQQQQALWLKHQEVVFP